MIIMGVDPGTRVTGYGIVESFNEALRPVDYGCIRPPPNLKLTDRYLIIFEAIEALIEKYHPDVLVVETQFVQKNPQSAIKLGMARGVIVVAAKKKGLAVFEYSPGQAKRAVVGNGQASKEQVQGMVKLLLNLESVPEPEDAADALALAICHFHSLRFRQLCDSEI